MTTLLVLLLASGGLEARANPGPLGPELRTAFYTSGEDPPTPYLYGVSPARAGMHYTVSNEWHIDLYAPAVTNLGGGFVGVGSDQCWLLIGWQRPERAWLMDYDPHVRDVHRLHTAFFIMSPDYATFRRLWDTDVDRTVKQVISTIWPSASMQAELFMRYLGNRHRVRKRLDGLHKNFLVTGRKSFLTDRETYDWTRMFVAEGRTRALVGDLHGATAMRGLGEVARAQGIPIRVFYVSNVEQYRSYDVNFRENVAALPHDGKSLVLRTMLTWALNGDYRYVAQPLGNFKAWLQHPATTGLLAMHKLPFDLSPDPAFHRFDHPPGSPVRE
jgi:hypothetical protein